MFSTPCKQGKHGPPGSRKRLLTVWFERCLESWGCLGTGQLVRGIGTVLRPSLHAGSLRAVSNFWFFKYMCKMCQIVHKIQTRGVSIRRLNSRYLAWPWDRNIYLKWSGFGATQTYVTWDLDEIGLYGFSLCLSFTRAYAYQHMSDRSCIHAGKGLCGLQALEAFANYTKGQSYDRIYDMCSPTAAEAPSISMCCSPSSFWQKKQQRYLSYVCFYYRRTYLHMDALCTCIYMRGHAGARFSAHVGG